uniref:Chondroitin sulfate proteoglycan 5 n=1 Tax=Corvus moneduloides TaxID=1196302 RepID=A0A8C3D6D7_CORMO
GARWSRWGPVRTPPPRMPRPSGGAGAPLTRLSLLAPLQHPRGPPKTPALARGEPGRARWRAAPRNGTWRVETPLGDPATAPALPGRARPPGPQLATDSAESDLLLAAGGSAAPRTPVLGEPSPVPAAGGDSGGPPELWAAASSPAPAQGARGWTDLTWLQEPITAATGPAKPPADRTGSEIIDVDYYDLFEGGEGLGGFPGGGRGAAGSARRREPEGAATPWALHELYDDFTPFDDADFYPTTSFYADGDDEDELEDEEEEEEEEDGGLEDENGYRPPTSAAPGAAPAPQDPRPTGHRAAAPPPPPGVSGGSPTAWPRPGERGPPENGSECRSGYVRHNSSCRSLCDLVPSYCHNGGQCYLVESHGAFCRCNTQDYTWHKGTRCESIVTDFQVMCVAVGSAALVVLLLFMLTVFFAKKLYLLKTENSKLRKTK